MAGDCAQELNRARREIGVSDRSNQTNVMGDYWKITAVDNGQRIAMPSVITGNTTDGRATSLEYDAMHQRVAKRGPQRTTIYMGDLYECEGATPPTAGGTVACDTHRYKIYGGGKLVAVVTDHDLTPRSTQFVHGDRLGSSALVTNEKGEQVGEPREFEAFGDTTADFGSTGINSGFAGQEHDAELGLINMGGRLYDPKVGRFITPDPFVTNPLDPQGLNRYSYVQNNPLNLVDPSGFSDQDPGVPPSFTGGSNPTNSGYSPSSSGTCNIDGSYSFPNSPSTPDSRVDVPTIMPDGNRSTSPRVDSSSSNPGGSRAPSPPSPPSPAAPSAPAQPSDGAPSEPVSQGGPPATPPSPEGGPGTQGVAGPGNVSPGAIANPVNGPQSPNNPGTSWSPGSSGTPSSAAPSGVGYRGSNGLPPGLALMQQYTFNAGSFGPRNAYIVAATGGALGTAGIFAGGALAAIGSVSEGAAALSAAGVRFLGGAISGGTSGAVQGKDSGDVAIQAALNGFVSVVNPGAMFFGSGGMLGVIGGVTNAGIANIGAQGLSGSGIAWAPVIGSGGARGFFGFVMGNTGPVGIGTVIVANVGGGAISGLVGGVIRTW